MVVIGRVAESEMPRRVLVVSRFSPSASLEVPLQGYVLALRQATSTCFLAALDVWMCVCVAS